MTEFLSQSPGSRQPPTVGRLIADIAEYFSSADLFYGHGTDNPHDEAAALVFHVMHLDHFGAADQYDQLPRPADLEAIARIASARVSSRQPLPYLLGEAWFAGLPFHVDANVLIPRSPVAELIEARFEPWIAPDQVASILEIGTGSGCIAIACALAFPHARIVATEISSAALAVASRNVERYELQDRLRLVCTDHADGLSDRFDVLVSNPPYVPVAEIARLPAEYHHEPALGLGSGADGLDSARRILQVAGGLLTPRGILVLEVGEQWVALQDAYPHLPFNWLEFEHGGIGVGLLHASALQS